MVFFVVNQTHFSGVILNDFVVGLWFDCITLAISFSPFYLIYFFPLPDNFRYNKWFQLVLKLFFHLLNILVIAANIVDVEYFKYTGKRSTADLFTFISTGDDMFQLLGAFFIDFWWMLVFLVVFVFVVEYLYRKIESKSRIENLNIFSKITQWFILVCLMLIVARGGFSLRPIGIIEATNYTKVKNVALVLNTPFTIIKTYGKSSLKEKKFFENDKAEKLFNPIRTTNPQRIIPEKTNVVILILESFGDEYCGLNSKNSFTPFFDSVLKQSLYFKNGFANGKKSIEAVPSILASIPTLMDNPYISSSYGNNKIESLPSLLKKEGYSSAFFHGATNGSMRFDGFAKQLGFDFYYGRKEYANETDFDGTWGILDHKFAPWTARQLTKMEEPFLGTLFTLSSHHPYFIPDEYKEKVKEGKEPICAALNYADEALKLFFEEAQKQSWYEHTIFVLCADHTPSSQDEKYNQRSMMYKIPIAFYYPNNTDLLKQFNTERLFQQIDIMPTLLDLLNLNTNYYSFGQSFYSLDSSNQVVTYLEGVYSVFYKSHMLTIASDKARNLYSHLIEANNELDSLRFYKNEVKIIEDKTKAIIQRYSRDLIQNQTTVE